MTRCLTTFAAIASGELWELAESVCRAHPAAWRGMEELSRRGEELAAEDDMAGEAAHDLVRIREKGLYREIRVLRLPGKNMSREAAKTTWLDETPPEIVEQRVRIDSAARARGPRRDGARPTKKERREIRKLRGR